MITLAEHVGHFRARLVQDALAEATAAYWNRRADQLAAALPRRGDYIGQSTASQREARAVRLTAEVRACRNRARVALIGGESW